MIYFATGQSPQRMGTRHPSIVPYECFQTKDGFANIGVANEKQWAGLCDALGLSGLATDPRFDTMAARIAHYNELRPILEQVLSCMTRADVIRLLGAGGIAVGPVNTVAEALEHPQVLAREMVAELTHPEYGPLKYLGIPIRLSDTPGKVQNAPPLYGEHTETVLRDLGFSASAISQLADSKVIDGILSAAAPVWTQKSK
jgi:crotonobetainyl-CoA:carnitine CoA-transferase CaiB-like acyl-CoA transferase